MAKYEVKRFKRSDISKLMINREQREMIAFVGAEALTATLETRGPAYSAFVDGELIVIAGINILWPGVGEAWAFLGGSYRKYGLFINRSVRKYLNEIAFGYKLERVQATVKKGHWVAIEWIDWLDFDYEGEMPGYFQGHTFLRYAKIFY